MPLGSTPTPCEFSRDIRPLSPKYDHTHISYTWHILLWGTDNHSPNVSDETVNTRYV